MKYPEFVRARLARDPWCALGARILTVDGAHRCDRRAEGLHHLRKRSSAGAIACEANTWPACNNCNGWVEDNPDAARDLGLVVREGDPRWPDLGQRTHDLEHVGTA